MYSTSSARSASAWSRSPSWSASRNERTTSAGSDVSLRLDALAVAVIAGAYAQSGLSGASLVCRALASLGPCMSVRAGGSYSGCPATTAGLDYHDHTILREGKACLQGR